jgi:hypothetical protein
MATTATPPSKISPTPADGSGPVIPPFDVKSYLDIEEKAAKGAIGRAFTELKATVTGGSADAAASGGASAKAKMQDTIDKHPFLSLGGAAVAGFATALAVVPSKEQQVLKKLAALERAVALHGNDVHHPKPGGKSLAQTLINSVAGIVKPLLLHGVTATLAAKTAGDTASETVAEQHSDPLEVVPPDH